MKFPLLPRWWIIFLMIGKAAAQNAFTVVQEDQTWSDTGAGDSEYIAAHRISTAGHPVVMAGNFETEVTFPGLTIVTLSGSGGVPSVFAGILDYNPGGDWEVLVSPFSVDKLEPKSPLTTTFPNAELRDLAVVSRDEYYVTGIIDDATSFINRLNTSFVLTSNSTALPRRGFIARADDGTFDAAYYTELLIQPRALSSDVGGGFLVVGGQERDASAGDLEGPDALLHRHALPLPAPVPDTPLPAPDVVSGGDLDDLSLGDVVGTTTGDVWAGGTKSGAGELGGVSDIWLGEANFTTGSITTALRAGSEATDRLGKMERGPGGEVLVAFSVSGRQVSFGPLTYDLDTDPAIAASTSSTHAFLAMVKSDNTPAWVTPLGISRGRGSVLTPKDLSVDDAGNTIVTFSGVGLFEIEGVNRVLDDSGQIVVNGSGRVVDYLATPSVDDPEAGAISTLENRLVFGASGGKATFASVESRDLPQSSQQISWVNPGLPGNTIESLSALVTAAGGQVHLESNYPGLGVEAVSAWLTRPQLAALLANPDVTLSRDPLVVETDSGGIAETESPDWALIRLFDPYIQNMKANDARHFYPSGFVQQGISDTQRVRVYVIDRGLEVDEEFDLHDFLDCPGNPSPVVYRGDQNIAVNPLVQDQKNALYDPDTTSNHPRQLINLLASVSNGTAAGTAMEIVGVDIYTGADNESGLTYLSYLLEGINAARLDAMENHPGVPAIFLIASSGVEGAGAISLNNTMVETRNEGILVILSAGNGGNLKTPGQVADYVPAKHGSLPGVITVGATSLGASSKETFALDLLNPISTQTNHDEDGSIISLYAPGQNVETGFGAENGTSFSCALVAGLAATHLARNPEATPAEIENALVQLSASHFYEKAGREINLARSVCAYQAWRFRQGLLFESNDADLDGLTDFQEFLGGSDPNDAGSNTPWNVAMTVVGDEIQIVTQLPQAFIRPDGTFHDGCWSGHLSASPDLQDWQPRDFELSLGTVSNGRQEMTLTIPPPENHAEKCFFRFDFSVP
ncbi:S8 family serine peptidase [Verrucomicrobiaceae bacterium 227]